jgi:DNA-binding MarR family transcriptional regulator
MSNATTAAKVASAKVGKGRASDAAELALPVPPMELEDHLFFLCTQVVYRRTAAIGTALKPLGLLPTEYRVLSSLLRKGPLTMQALSQWTAYERTRLTHLLHAMEERGWATRTSSEADKRTVVVSATRVGEALFAQAKAAVDEVTDVITSNNSEAELKTVRKALRTMRAKLIEMGT